MKTPRPLARPDSHPLHDNETVALFLGPKLLGELRILMRLASNSRQDGTTEAPEKSF